MASDALSLPLLEFLAYKAGCTYLSDLAAADSWQRMRLARVLELVPAGAASLREWNDALDYLAHVPPDQTAEKARVRLLVVLRNPAEDLRNKGKKP